MLRSMLKSKLHRIKVTEADLNYMGSITIDERIMKEADILPYEKVQVVNLNNGERFETYTIKGEYGSKTVCLNGAAARLVQPGDEVIVMTYLSVDEKEAEDWSPCILFFDDNNEIVADN